MTQKSSLSTLSGYQAFIKDVYGFSNDRYFTQADMLSNIERFVMRGLKGIRKKDKKKTIHNFLIAQSWFMSLMNQLHIQLEVEIWKRFPYACSYCMKCPCGCDDKNSKRRAKPTKRKTPTSIREYQLMFEAIYPAANRTLEHAGIHLAEETGELSEAILTFRGNHRENDFEKIKLEAADFFSCLIAVFNSLEVDFANKLTAMFSDNCHVCHRRPCQCDFNHIINYKS